LKHDGFGIDTDSYWEDFIKKGPKFIIGAIKHYEWENGKGEYSSKKDTKVTDAMIKANDKDEAKKLGVEVKEDWDTTKAADVAEFLYRTAINRTGKDLIKLSETLPSDTPDKKDDKETGFMAHLGRNWGWYTAGGLFLAAAIGAAIYFWEDIKGWFGTSEEGTDKDEENE